MSSRSTACRNLITRSPNRRASPCSASPMRNPSLPRPAQKSATVVIRLITASARITCSCRPSKAFATPKAITRPSRMSRPTGRATRPASTANSGASGWGDEGYAMEELVAELGSAFLSADLELTPDVREDHAAYIASWIKVLKNDKRAIFTAASHAQRAVDFLHGASKAAEAATEAA